MIARHPGVVGGKVAVPSPSLRSASGPDERHAGRQEEAPHGDDGEGSAAGRLAVEPEQRRLLAGDPGIAKDLGRQEPNRQGDAERHQRQVIEEPEPGCGVGVLGSRNAAAQSASSRARAAARRRRR